MRNVKVLCLGKNDSTLVRSFKTCGSLFDVETSEKLTEIDVEPDLLVLNTQYLKEADKKQTHKIRNAVSQSTMVLQTREQIGQYLPLFKQYRIGMVFKESFDTFPLFCVLMHVLATHPSEVTLSAFFGKKANITKYDIRFHEDKRSLVAKVIRDGSAEGLPDGVVYNARLVLEELLNNALYHAFRNKDASSRYQTGTFRTLQPGDKVEVELGHDDTTYALSVWDNAGTFNSEMLFGKIAAHLSKENLYDETGRGLYLCYASATGLWIDIRKGVSTRVVAFMDKRGEPLTRFLAVREHD